MNMKITGISKFIFVLALMSLAKTVWCQTVSSEDARPARCPVAHKGREQPLSNTDTAINCDSLRFKIWDYQGAGKMQQMYDTVQKFIDHCYNDVWAPSMFRQFTSAVQSLAPSDTSLWRKGRQWLESVLYLNTTNPEYFCRCVEAIAGTFSSASDTTESLYWKDLNRNLSIEEWLVQNTVCDTPYIQNGINGARASQYMAWREDTTVPLDTTLPTLDSIEPGLRELLEKHFLYADVDPELNAPAILSNASASPNPADAGTVISFTMNKEAYVRITLYDVLGKQLGASAFESFFGIGNKSVPISLAGLPSGTYYARIQTAYGEVQTVKLVKQ